MAFVISGEAFRRQRVEVFVGSAREKAKPRKCRQRGRKACVHDFYNRHVFPGSEVADRAIL